MARVRKEVQEEVERLINEIPDEILNTCGLCSRTLYDRLVSIATQTNAPQKTVCDLFATRYNERRAKHDHVSGQAFLERIKWIDRVNKRELSGESTKDRECEIDRSVERQPTETDCDLCGDTHQINRETTCEPDAEDSQFRSDGDTLPESEGQAGSVKAAQDSNAGSKESEETVVTVCSESSPDICSKPDPYDVLVELWRTKQYTAEDVYEVFLAELLARFSPDDVDKYKRDAGVTLDELSIIVGKTIRQYGGLSSEEVHYVIRNGLEAYGGWSKIRTDKAIGSAPPKSEEPYVDGDF